MIYNIFKEMNVERTDSMIILKYAESPSARFSDRTTYKKTIKELIMYTYVRLS